MLIAPPTKRLICYTDADCALARRRLLDATMISNDIETIPFNKKNKAKNYPFVMTINCYSGLMEDGSIESYCFPFQRGKAVESGAPTYIDEIYYTCRELNLSGIPFTGQNYIYDLMWLMRYGLPVANWAYDSMLMFWARWPELPKRLDFISSILLDDYQYWKAGRKSDDFIVYCNYGMSDTEYTLRNTMILIELMLDDSAMRLNYFDAFKRTIAGLGMSAKGMRTWQPAMNEMETELTKAKDRAWNRLRYLVADEAFNPNSPKQKSELIYQLMGARKRNEKGRYVNKESDASSGAVALRAIRGEHPVLRRVVNGILEAIEPAKQLSNVVGLEFLSGRFLTTYDGAGTTTTRFSSRASSFGHGGNAQNIRKDYRRFLVADADSFLLDIDFSGADDWFVGFESQEQVKIDLLRSGKDIHCSNGVIFFPNWTYEDLLAGKRAHDPKVVHPITGIRQITKKLCHGMSYLMAGITLLMTAGREAIVAAAIELGNVDAGTWNQAQLVEFCAGLEIAFRNHYPRLRRDGPDSWYADVRQELIDTGGVTTIFRYYQRFLNSPHDDATLRAAAATYGQANTAGRINMALNEMIHGNRVKMFRDGPAPDANEEALRINEKDFGISLRLQTHDSFTFNIRFTHPRWREGVERIFKVMSRPVICKGQQFALASETEVSYMWAGHEGRTIKGVADIETFLNEVKSPLV